MPDISLMCPNRGCRARLRFDESLLGETCFCPGCRTSFVLVRPAEAPAGFDWGPGRVLLEDYVIEGPLGEGGMGTVYLARSRGSGRRFAVKTIRRERLGDESSRRRFLDELQTWIDLPEHPHL